MPITFILDDRFYAFDARVGTSIKNLAVNERVVFNTVVSNHGLGYNASSGIFTAHRSGIYVFDWTILPWQGSNAHTAITASFSHGVTAILENPVFCNRVAKWRY